MASGQNTFVAGNVLTAAQVNAYLMDQSRMIVTSGTRPTAAAQGGALLKGMRIFETDTNRELTYNGTNWCQTNTAVAQTTASETTTSTSYTNLATVGPSVTITTGTKALVTVGTSFQGSSTNLLLYMSWACSGATTIAVADAQAVEFQGAGINAPIGRMSREFYVDNLTAGNNTFTAKYKTNGGTATYEYRTISAVAIL